MNIPNIPDNLHKALFVIGLIIVGFAYYKYDQNIIFLENEAKNVNELAEEKYFQTVKVLNLQTEFEILCLEESKKLNIENFCEKDKDGDLQFYGIINGNKEQLKISDSLAKIWHTIETERESRDILNDKLEFAIDDLNDFILLAEETNYFNIALGIFGGLLAFIGLGRWWKIQNIQDKIVESELPSSTKFKHCQSCGRNFSFRILHGTNSDNSSSEMFCLDCFQEGEFTSYLDEESFKILKDNKIKTSANKRDRVRIKDRFEKLIRWNIDDYESHD